MKHIPSIVRCAVRLTDDRALCRVELVWHQAAHNGGAPEFIEGFGRTHAEALRECLLALMGAIKKANKIEEEG